MWQLGSIDVLGVDSLTFSCDGSSYGIFGSFSLDVRGNTICKLLKLGNANGDALLCLLANLLHPRRNDMLCGNRSIGLHLPSALDSVFVIPRRFRLPAVHVGGCTSLRDNFCPGFDCRRLARGLTVFKLSSDIIFGSLSVNRRGGTFVYCTLTAGASLLIVSRPAGKLSVPSGDRFHQLVTDGVARRGAVVVSARRIHSVSDLLSRVIVVSNSRILLGTSDSRVYHHLLFTRRPVSRPASKTLFIRPSISNGDIVLPGTCSRRDHLGLRLLFGNILTRHRHFARLFGWGREFLEFRELCPCWVNGAVRYIGAKLLGVQMVHMVYNGRSQ